MGSGLPDKPSRFWLELYSIEDRSVAKLVVFGDCKVVDW